MSRNSSSVYICWPPAEHPAAFLLEHGIICWLQWSELTCRPLVSTSVASPLHTCPHGWSSFGFGGVAAVYLLCVRAKACWTHWKTPITFMVFCPWTQSASKLLFSTLNGEPWFFSLQASNICELILPKFHCDFQISQRTRSPEALQGGKKVINQPCFLHIRAGLLRVLAELALSDLRSCMRRCVS